MGTVSRRDEFCHRASTLPPFATRKDASAHAGTGVHDGNQVSPNNQ